MGDRSEGSRMTRTYDVNTARFRAHIVLGFVSPEPKFHEHDKLSEISAQSQSCGEFLDWLRDEKSAVLYQWAEWEEEREYGWPSKKRGTYSVKIEKYVPFSYSITKLLAEFFEIDLKLVEDEKEAMLAHSRGRAA